MKTIYSDAMISFGKYKGRPVIDVLAEDTAYFYWLQQAGMYSLDKEIEKVVVDWVIKHPSLASKTRHSAEKIRKEKGISESEVKSSAKIAPESESVTTEVHYVKEAPRSENWGCW